MLILSVLGWSRQCPSENRRQVVLMVLEVGARCSEARDSLVKKEALRTGGTDQRQKGSPPPGEGNPPLLLRDF